MQNLNSSLCRGEVLVYNASLSYLLKKVLLYLHAKGNHLLISSRGVEEKEREQYPFWKRRGWEGME